MNEPTLNAAKMPALDKLALAQAAFQSETLRLLAASRSPESFLAGGTVLNAGSDSPRYSKDLDIFHDVEASVVTSAETDAATLRQAGYVVEWLLKRLPAEEVGCLYLNAGGKPITPDPSFAGISQPAPAFWQRSGRVAGHQGIIIVH